MLCIYKAKNSYDLSLIEIFKHRIVFLNTLTYVYQSIVYYMKKKIFSMMNIKTNST